MVIYLPFCPKCGNELAEKAEYCPRCGAPQKTTGAQVATHYRRQEKGEKQEKQEKEEKEEKHEKGETSRFWVLAAGLILIVLGATSILTNLFLEPSWRGPSFLIAVGVVIVVLAVFGAAMASKRHPEP